MWLLDAARRFVLVSFLLSSLFSLSLYHDPRSFITPRALSPSLSLLPLRLLLSVFTVTCFVPSRLAPSAFSVLSYPSTFHSR